MSLATVISRISSRQAILAILLIGLGSVGLWKARTYLVARSHLAEGRSALERGDAPEARRRLELCLAQWPESAEANYFASRAARRCGDEDAARRYLNRAETLGQPPADIALERAFAKAQSGRIGETEDLLLEHLHRGGGESVEVIEVLLPAYMAEFRLVEANNLSARWVELRPDSAKAWLRRADLLERLRYRNESIEAYRKLVGLTPDDLGARLNLARLLLEARQPIDEVAGHCEFVLRTDPDNVLALVLLAACRENQARTDDAVNLLDRALAKQPGHAKALHSRGRLEMQRGKPVSAVAFLRRSAESDPSDVEALYTLFLGLQQAGTPAEIKDAEERWKRGDADLKRVTALGLVIAGSPRDPDPRREIGELFLRNGRTVEGLRWLESALQLDPRHTATHKVLADHYERTGQPDLAKSHAAAAKETKPK